mmetsp:Transcript_9978/g.25817  ORF Transcript_9978/g.25817 Transcript_9978/m.25817 type:complete len:210 (-) Transcript_9978:3345-3974(-)
MSEARSASVTSSRTRPSPSTCVWNSAAGIGSTSAAPPPERPETSGRLDGAAAEKTGAFCSRLKSWPFSAAVGSSGMAAAFTLKSALPEPDARRLAEGTSGLSLALPSHMFLTALNLSRAARRLATKLCWYTSQARSTADRASSTEAWRSSTEGIMHLSRATVMLAWDASIARSKSGKVWMPSIVARATASSKTFAPSSRSAIAWTRALS